MTLSIDLVTLLTIATPFMMAYIGSTIKLMVDISAIKEHLKQLNGRVAKAESAYDSHIQSCHLR